MAIIDHDGLYIVMMIGIIICLQLNRTNLLFILIYDWNEHLSSNQCHDHGYYKWWPLLLQMIMMILTMIMMITNDDDDDDLDDWNPF